MKAIIVLIAGMFLTYNAFAQDNGTKSNGNKKSEYGAPKVSDQFCAMETNGKMEVMASDGHVLKQDIDLKNGSTVTASGAVIKKDGSRDVLGNGQCVDINGHISSKTTGKLSKERESYEATSYNNK
jgi:hypothetical protein